MLNSTIIPSKKVFFVNRTFVYKSIQKIDLSKNYPGLKGSAKFFFLFKYFLGCRESSRLFFRPQGPQGVNTEHFEYARALFNLCKHNQKIQQ